MDSGSTLEWVLRRDRWIVLGALAGAIALAWGYILAGAGMDMGEMSMGSPMTPVWTPGHFLLMFIMWWVMMVAMMLPSAAPMVLLFAALSRKYQQSENAVAPTGVFVAGYIAAWGAFSVVATGLQWGLQEVTLLTPMLASASVTLGAVLLIAAGIYQLTPLKYACLRHCRTPIDYLGHHWRNGMGHARCAWSS